ncbi:hypothetical protein MNBD_GAMMA01-100 [hydrothermal vent metagenome]|uniref:YdbS-like PH domain-containing protein n=1 Tax=hydrothermal vent metagenome TaxID=652676 RepID=A0A3B0VAJ2_9ZZZZ
MKNLNLKKQERSYLKLNRIILTVVFAIITLVLSTGIFFVPLALWAFATVIAAVWLLYWLLFIYQSAEYKHFSYTMDDYGLYINRGVFWRKKIIVPRNRVQHTDITQGPLDRKYDLAELIVHTAGTRNASVKLPGILHANAETLRKSLSFAESQDAV